MVRGGIGSVVTPRTAKWGTALPDPTLPLKRTRFLERTTSRRTILAGTAALAAAGAATVAGIAVESRGSSGRGGGPRLSDLVGGATPKVDLNAVIADPTIRAAHLLRRAGFGGTTAQIDEFASLSREDAADRLLNYDVVDNSALDARIAAGNFNLNYSARGATALEMQRWWLTRMAYTARPLQERMTLIWHGLLTSQLSKVSVQFARLMVGQNELYRANALGQYDALIQAVSKDPAMLYYLDNIDSTKAHPNENYARELMELFTLGVGNYTEEDVRESARAFTGWRVTPPQRTGDNEKDLAGWNPQFVLAAAQHDSGTKTFLGQTGNFDGADIVDIIMQQPAAGRFITTRLFQEFANYDPASATIDRLVGVWESSGHSIKAIVRTVLVSDEFYSQRSYRGFVRSPVELLVGAVRGLELETDFSAVGSQDFRGMNQALFEPPNVAGWPGGDTWLSSSTLFARANFLDTFLFPRSRPNAVPALSPATTSEELVDTALKALVDANVPAATRQALVDYSATIVEPTARAAAVAYLVLASPEFQLI